MHNQSSTNDYGANIGKRGGFQSSQSVLNNPNKMIVQASAQSLSALIGDLPMRNSTDINTSQMLIEVDNLDQVITEKSTARRANDPMNKSGFARSTVNSIVAKARIELETM